MQVVSGQLHGSVQHVHQRLHVLHVCQAFGRALLYTRSRYRAVGTNATPSTREAL